MEINHVALYCMDLEAMREFFIRFFGAKSNEQYHNPRTGLRTYILSFDDGARLEIMNRPETQPTDNDSNRTGFIHISFAAGNKEEVDAQTIRLKEAGYEVLNAPRTTGDGYYESCIAGPEGIMIEITV